MLTIAYHDLWRKKDAVKAKKCKRTSVELKQGRKITLKLPAHLAK